MQRRSWLHEVPAGLKLLGLLLISVGLYSPWQYPVLALVSVLVVCGHAGLGDGGWRRLAVIGPLLPMFILVFALQWWSQDLAAATSMLLRMLLLIWLANLLTLTTRMDAMMDALRPVLAPLRWVGVEPARIAFAVALLLRFVPVLMAVLAALMEAWRARGGGRQRWRLAVPLLVNAIRLSDHVSEALAARGGIVAASPVRTNTSPEGALS